MTRLGRRSARFRGRVERGRLSNDRVAEARAPWPTDQYFNASWKNFHQTSYKFDKLSQKLFKAAAGGTTRPQMRNCLMVLKQQDKYQSDTNGALTPETRARIRVVKDKLGYSWQSVGDEFGFSNTFTLGIARDADPMRIRSKHVEGLIQNLEALEVKAGIRKTTDPSAALVPTSTKASDLSLEDLIAAINAKGFNVTFSAKN